MSAPVITIDGKRAHPCVFTVPCPWCRAVAGELCSGAHGDGITSTHYMRRANHTALKRGKPLPYKPESR